jgi:thymidylate kinase
MIKMVTICLFGPDGSGKTTLARALARKLEGYHFKVRISWIRGTHTLASMLAKFLSRSATFRGSDNLYYGVSIPNSARRVWQLIEFISVLPILLTSYILPSLLGYIVIAERYIPDFLVWVSLTTRDECYLKRLEARFMLALSMKANMKVYVTASKDELAIRKGGEVNQKFLSGQLKLYGELAKH